MICIYYKWLVLYRYSNNYMKGSKMEKPPKISPVRIILSDDEKRNLTNEEFIEK